MDQTLKGGDIIRTIFKKSKGHSLWDNALSYATVRRLVWSLKSSRTATSQSDIAVVKAAVEADAHFTVEEMSYM